MHTLYIRLPQIYVKLTLPLLNIVLTVNIAYKLAKIAVFQDL
jgi:hypothetical protein